jgi:hypothetical protein
VHISIIVFTMHAIHLDFLLAWTVLTVTERVKESIFYIRICVY